MVARRMTSHMNVAYWRDRYLGGTLYSELRIDSCDRREFVFCERYSWVDPFGPRGLNVGAVLTLYNTE
jgi:hypothetical protein